ncbi:MAG TPA: thiamine-phosphate kinase [Gemmatimonadales bacterium]|nr:thiamine-phosphate kinase [Gemmatimonadales bacterium]
MKTGLALGPGAEFDRIRSIVAELGSDAQGIGDDCALLPTGNEFLALSTDVSVEQVHFRMDWIALREVGWRSTAAALSDLAAEAAQPAGILCALTLPKTRPEADLLEVMRGVRDAARSVSAPVLGGDLSNGPCWSLAVTVIGRTARPVTRRGAQPGDGLWVTGELGGSRAALEAWRRGEQPSSAARARFARPVPRISVGQWLGARGARAMLDLSDGLAGDVGHLAAASGMAMEIEVERVPVAPEVEPEARRLGLSPQQFAAEGGEDFELLVAMPPEFDGAALFARECELGLTQVGRVLAGSGARFLQHGRSVALKGFNHFG